jgi:hypothetical protein
MTDFDEESPAGFEAIEGALLIDITLEDQSLVDHPLMHQLRPQWVRAGLAECGGSVYVDLLRQDLAPLETRLELTVSSG